MPLPKLATLYLLRGGSGGELPSVGEFGRLHLTKSEMALLDRAERKRIREMAFGIVKAAELPVVTIGKVAPTSPRVGISELGKVVFNSFVAKKWVTEEIDRAAVLYDPAEHKVGIIPIKKGVAPAKNLANTLICPVQLFGKDGKATGQASIGAAETEGGKKSITSFLSLVAKYDFKASGNYSFDCSYNEKLGAYIFVVPEGVHPNGPAVKVVREKKEKKTAGADTTTAAAATTAAVEAPEEEELMIAE